MLEQFADCRREILSQAKADVIKWCPPPDSNISLKKRSDQFWIRLFAVEPERIDANMAHLFLTGFQLTNRVTWDKIGFSETVRTFCQLPESDPVAAVSFLSERLRQHVPKRTRQTSAASKIANFAKPNLQIFIWDSMAMKSARVRAAIRLGKKGTPRGLQKSFLDSDKSHDYAEFSAACRTVLTEERENRFRLCHFRINRLFFCYSRPDVRSFCCP